MADLALLRALLLLLRPTPPDRPRPGDALCGGWGEDTLGGFSSDGSRASG